MCPSRELLIGQPLAFNGQCWKCQGMEKDHPLTWGLQHQVARKQCWTRVAGIPSRYSTEAHCGHETWAGGSRLLLRFSSRLGLEPSNQSIHTLRALRALDQMEGRASCIGDWLPLRWSWRRPDTGNLPPELLWEILQPCQLQHTGEGRWLCPETLQRPSAAFPHRRCWWLAGVVNGQRDPASVLTIPCHLPATQPAILESACQPWVPSSETVSTDFTVQGRALVLQHMNNQPNCGLAYGHYSRLLSYDRSH